MLLKSEISDRGFSIITIIIILFLTALIAWGFAAYKAAEVIHELFAENKKLKQAITRLTKEDQIGYAKVLKQYEKDGKLITKLKFVETARDDKNEILLTKKYTIEGDVIHFDALIVKFDTRMVLDGKERSLYIWRRVYGEKMSPSKAFKIEDEGTEPERYKGLLGKRSFWDKITFKKDNTKIFWESIWDLANDKDKLKKYGITAIYGNVVYSKLKPGLIYVFKITNTGQVYPETIPDM